MFRWICKNRTGQKYRLGCAAATGAGWSFGSVSPSSSLSFLCLCDFLFFRIICELNFPIRFACYSISFLFAGIARWVVARRWKDIGFLGRSFNILPFSVSARLAMSYGERSGVRPAPQVSASQRPVDCTFASHHLLAAVPSPSSCTRCTSNCHKSTHTCRRMYRLEC